MTAVEKMSVIVEQSGNWAQCFFTVLLPQLLLPMLALVYSRNSLVSPPKTISYDNPSGIRNTYQ
jgi:hypothetical protein